MLKYLFALIQWTVHLEEKKSIMLFWGLMWFRFLHFVRKGFKGEFRSQLALRGELGTNLWSVRCSTGSTDSFWPPQTTQPYTYRYSHTQSSFVYRFELQIRLELYLIKQGKKCINYSAHGTASLGLASTVRIKQL